MEMGSFRMSRVITSGYRFFHSLVSLIFEKQILRGDSGRTLRSRILLGPLESTTKAGSVEALCGHILNEPHISTWIE